MAILNIKIDEAEKVILLKVVNKHRKEVISVAKLAKEAGINPNRARFIVDELIQDGRLVKVIAKKYNDAYIRYTYEVP